MAPSKITQIENRINQFKVDTHYHASSIYQNIAKDRMKNIEKCKPEFFPACKIQFEDEIASTP